MDLLTALILGNFAFTAGAYAWSWKVYDMLNKQINNHLKTEVLSLRQQLHKYKLCDDACTMCKEEVE